MANAVIDMPKRELPIDPYILGLWLGDGYSNIGYICSGKEDVENLFQYGKVRKAENGHRSDYYICHIEGLSKSLRLAGLIDNHFRGGRNRLPGSCHLLLGGLSPCAAAGHQADCSDQAE